MPTQEPRTAQSSERPTAAAAAGLTPVTVICAALAGSTIIFPRFVPLFILAGLAIGILASLRRLTLRWGERVADEARGLLSHPVLLPAAAFAVWALLACAWSVKPSGGLAKAAFVVALVVMAAALRRVIADMPQELAAAIGRGVVIGMLAAGTYLAIETATHAWLARKMFNMFPALQEGYERHLWVRKGVVVKVSPTNLNRSAAAFALLFWPTLLMAARTFRDRRRKIALGWLGLIALALLIRSDHQSTQLALAASGMAFGLAFISPDDARRIMVAGWIVAAVLMLPIVQAASRYEAELSDWLFFSAKDRLLIWSYTAEQIAEHPVLGIGTNSTHELHKLHKQANPEPSLEVDGDKDSRPKIVLDTSKRSPVRPHAHNAYLQVLYELGVIGAALFAWLGFAAIRSSKSYPWPDQQVLLGQLAMTAAMMASSYGIWQNWYQTLMAAGPLLILAALRSRRSDAVPAAAESGSKSAATR